MKRLLLNLDVCIEYYGKNIYCAWFLVNKSSPLAQFSIDYEEIDDDDEEEQQNNNDQILNHQQEKIK